MPPPLPPPLRRPPPLRTFNDSRAIIHHRDRALDHVVEKEKHLLPFHNLKDLIISTKNAGDGLPLDVINKISGDLRLPFRPIRFIRLFPSAFIEEFPSPSQSATPRPIVRASDGLKRVHDEEQRVMDAAKSDAADRLLKLLMLAPRRRIPLSVVEELRWDLGLPRDYVDSIIADYPHYFGIVPSEQSGGVDLELVCYRKDLAVSMMEKYAGRTGGYRRGMPLAFPVKFSQGFELDKKVRKWLEEWQKLPYISPYENGLNLVPKSDAAEKWTVAMLHEVLHLLVPKKTEKKNLILLGKHVGLPMGFKKVFDSHPGIFYVSSKLGTETVVLREAYRRHMLVENHPVMGLRYQYIHLMHKGKQQDTKKKKSRGGVSKTSSNDNDFVDGEEEFDEEEDDDDFVEEEDELSPSSNDEESDDEDYDAISANDKSTLGKSLKSKVAV